MRFGLRKLRELVQIPVSVTVLADGSVICLDNDGNPLSDRVAGMVQRQHRGAILRWLQEQCDAHNAEMEALINIHLATPAPSGGIMAKPRPEPPRTRGLTSRLFGRYRKRAWEKYERALLEWERDTQALKTDVGVMSAVLSSALSSIRWPWQTSVSFDIRDGGSTVLLDVDLPGMQNIPVRLVRVSERDLRLVVEDHAESQRQLDYLTHIHAIGFRLIGETFARLPAVLTVVLSGGLQRVDAAGCIVRWYLYSVRVPRAMWEQIDFGNLGTIDVVDCFERFQLRRCFDKRGIISPPVEPFAE